MTAAACECSLGAVVAHLVVLLSPFAPTPPHQHADIDGCGGMEWISHDGVGMGVVDFFTHRDGDDGDDDAG